MPHDGCRDQCPTTVPSWRRVDCASWRLGIEFTLSVPPTRRSGMPDYARRRTWKRKPPASKAGHPPIRRHPMSDRILELLHRNLQEVFGEGDTARRRTATGELYTDDCVLFAPPGKFVGR